MSYDLLLKIEELEKEIIQLKLHEFNVQGHADYENFKNACKQFSGHDNCRIYFITQQFTHNFKMYKTVHWVGSGSRLSDYIVSALNTLPSRESHVTYHREEIKNKSLAVYERDNSQIYYIIEKYEMYENESINILIKREKVILVGRGFKSMENAKLTLEDNNNNEHIKYTMEVLDLFNFKHIKHLFINPPAK